MARLYIEAFGGLAGDMLLAALLDLGDPRWTLADLEAMAADLLPGSVELRLERVWRGNLSGAHLAVRTAESGTQPHRGYRDLQVLIERSRLSVAVQQRALAVLWAIAQAEGAVHGCDPLEVHFHEIGAIDTLLDVCGACLALERLEVDTVLASAPLVGSGSVRCAHGEMPVPAPAVAQLLRGRSVRMGGEGERLTPTGAALLVSLCADFEEPLEFRAERIGYGAGTRDPKSGPPNLCRVQWEASAAQVPQRALLWEGALHLDDMRGEELAPAIEAARAAGALDVWWSSVAMKKGRPGVRIGCLVRSAQRAAVETALFAHTSSLGLRWWSIERSECAREVHSVQVLGREIRVKLRLRAGAAPSEFDISPEYEDLAAACAAQGRSLREWERLAIEAYRQSRS